MNDDCCTIFHALADPNRLKILEMLKDTELCVSDITARLNISQPSISHHLDILKRSGLVQFEKRGRSIFYSFSDDVLVECCGKQFRLFDLVLKRRIRLADLKEAGNG
jgi:DNA-binding transcriptional ArsR family regulator